MSSNNNNNNNIDAQQAHAILGPFAVPILGSIPGILAGVLTGGAGFHVAFRNTRAYLKKDPKFRGDET
jgi:hypothetical protein